MCLQVNWLLMEQRADHTAGVHRSHLAVSTRPPSRWEKAESSVASHCFSPRLSLFCLSRPSPVSSLTFCFLICFISLLNSFTRHRLPRALPSIHFKLCNIVGSLSVAIFTPLLYFLEFALPGASAYTCVLAYIYAFIYIFLLRNGNWMNLAELQSRRLCRKHQS